MTFCHLIFGDKAVRVLNLRICNHLPESMKVKSFQIFEKSLNDWCGPNPKWM